MTLLDLARKDTELRPYQIESKVKIYEAWQECRSVMFQMPTGTGKTRLFSSIIKDIREKTVSDHERNKILVLAHRTELIEQIYNTLAIKYSLGGGIIKSGFEEKPTLLVQIASVQTLSRRLSRWSDKRFTYIIIDEAHHALASTYQKILEAFPDAKILGVTATPYRLSGESFDKLFDKLIVSQSVSDFIKQGYLSDYKYYSIKANSRTQHLLNGINEFGADGDYKESAMMAVCDKDYIRSNLVDSYLKYAKGKKGIIYTICKEHNQHIEKNYSELGLKVVSIDSDTRDDDRKEMVSQFRQGKIDIICNVNIFSEGFDCPDIEFIQLARPTMSLSLYLQQVGRGLRPAKGKENAIIIDNVGLFNRFGLPSTYRKWAKHFHGQKNTESYQNALPTKNLGNSRAFNLTEGDEEMGLVYSSGVINPEPEKKAEQKQVPTNTSGKKNKAGQDGLNLTSLNSRYSPKEINRIRTSMHEMVPAEFKSVKDLFLIRYHGYFGLCKRRTAPAELPLPEGFLPIEELVDFHIRPQYQEMTVCPDSDLAIVKASSKYGMINVKDGSITYPLEYRKIISLGAGSHLLLSGSGISITIKGKVYCLKGSFDDCLVQHIGGQMYLHCGIRQTYSLFQFTDGEFVQILPRKSNIKIEKLLRYHHLVLSKVKDYYFLGNESGLEVFPSLYTNMMYNSFKPGIVICERDEQLLYLDMNTIKEGQMTGGKKGYSSIEIVKKK